MTGKRLLRLLGFAAILLPVSILLGRRHERGLRAGRVAELQRLLEGSLLEPLRRDPAIPSMGEYDVVTAVARQPGVADLVYLNEYAEVRWFEDARSITMDLARFSERFPLPNSVIDAHTTGLPFVSPLPDGRSYSISLPMVDGGKVHGVVFLKATDAALSALLKRGARLFPPAKPRAQRPAPIGHVGEDNVRSSFQHYHSGLIFFHKGDSKRAREEWRVALLLDPGNEYAQEGLQRLRQVVAREP